MSIRYELTMPPQDGEKYEAKMDVRMFDDSATARALVEAMVAGVKAAGGSAVYIEETRREVGL